MPHWQRERHADPVPQRHCLPPGQQPAPCLPQRLVLPGGPDGAQRRGQWHHHLQGQVWPALQRVRAQCLPWPAVPWQFHVQPWLCVVGACRAAFWVALPPCDSFRLSYSHALLFTLSHTPARLHQITAPPPTAPNYLSPLSPILAVTLVKIPTRSTIAGVNPAQASPRLWPSNHLQPAQPPTCF